MSESVLAAIDAEINKLQGEIAKLDKARQALLGESNGHLGSETISFAISGDTVAPSVSDKIAGFIATSGGRVTESQIRSKFGFLGQAPAEIRALKEDGRFRKIRGGYWRLR